MKLRERIESIKKYLKPDRTFVIRHGKNDHVQDAMSYMMRGMLDNMHLANNPPMHVRSAGCSDPADKSGSSSAK